MKLVIYQSQAPKTHGQFFWHVTASNGKKIADSGEGYKRLQPLERITKKLFPAAYDGSGKIKLVVKRGGQ